MRARVLQVHIDLLLCEWLDVNGIFQCEQCRLVIVLILTATDDHRDGRTCLLIGIYGSEAACPVVLGDLIKSVEQWKDLVIVHQCLRDLAWDSILRFELSNHPARYGLTLLCPSGKEKDDGNGLGSILLSASQQITSE